MEILLKLFFFAISFLFTVVTVSLFVIIVTYPVDPAGTINTIIRARKNLRFLKNAVFKPLDEVSEVEVVD